MNSRSKSGILQLHQEFVRFAIARRDFGFIFGERGRNRTYNLVIKSHLLCQLSYAPRLGGS